MTSETPATITDVLGEPWTSETIALAPDEEGEVVATLVAAPAVGDTDRAVLHVHGFSDYFFHAEFGDWWRERGHHMYALDLRKYGRSLRPHQSATYVADLDTYFEELDAAWERITRRDGRREVVISAHSTGGLVVALWADSRRPEALGGMVLNSPWLDLQGPPVLRTRLANRAVDLAGRRRPMGVLGRDVRGFYGRGLHRDHDGEWEFDLTWKPVESFPVRFGWLRAIRAGHARLQRGLAVPAPVLVLSSDRSSNPKAMGEEVHSTDIVLDVRQIRRWATAISATTTYIAVPGAVHDVILSRAPVRAVAYAEIDRWMRAYVDATATVTP